MSVLDSDFTMQKVHFKQMDTLWINFKKTSKSRYTASYLETRLELLESYWNKIQLEHEKIVKDQNVTVEDLSEYLKNSYSKIEETYLDFKTTIKEYFTTLQSDQPTTQVQTSSSCSGHSQIKLPPINLPTFSGNYRDWLNFKDLFTSLIDSNKELSCIQKHHYLRSSLTGEAEQLLRHFEVTAANYQKAWETLVARFSNKRLLVNNIFNRLLHQRKLTTECSKGLKELLDTTNECINALKNLEIDTNSWDPFLVHNLVSKLDIETHKYWEQSLGATTDLPTYTSLTQYLEGRFRAMEMVQSAQKKDTPRRDNMTTSLPQKPKHIKSFTAEVKSTCTFCNKSHYICHCAEFAQLDIEKRKEFVKNNGLCFNCLVKGHSIKFCRQDTSCRKCNRKHHTLLHHTNVVATPIVTREPSSEETEVSEIPSFKVSVGDQQKVLATAQFGVKGKDGTTYHMRALVDPGSQASFITESSVQLLGLKKVPFEAHVTGIEDQPFLTKFVVYFDTHSVIDTSFVTRVEAHVIKKLTPVLPTREFMVDKWPELTNLDLADQDFYKPSSIQVLLGVDVYADIIQDGLYKHNLLIAQKSRLGWLVSGTTKSTYRQTHNVIVSTRIIEVDELLRRFWEIEEYTPKDKPLTLLEKQCEEHFTSTHTRNEDGQYVVRLPLRNPHTERLGDTKALATQRLLHMEKRFARQPKLQGDYVEFMDQYQSMNHMEDVDPLEMINHKGYYLPHHAIIRESSTTTKLRVVFDGSAKPTDGTSLNEELLVGPSLQQDIRDLIIRWRSHKICLLADVKRMYRQILVAKNDTNYQRILWRNSPLDNIVEKRLLTVTYGTSCAPFLAIRTLKQLAEDEKLNFPDVVDVINCDFYMDDLLTGANDEESAIHLQERITKVMAKGHFKMHKWASNSPVVLRNIPNKHQVTKESIDITMDDTIKALGIRWNTFLDDFELKLDIPQNTKPYTKTTVLSDIARSFDLLGFLGPVIITAKILLQKLWLSGIGWNDELIPELAKEWSDYRDQLVNMETILLVRWYHTDFNNIERVEVHGFSDASCVAYAAVVYLRVIAPSQIYTSLVIAKTKVAPVKQVSLPRLELCRAVLLAKLIYDVKTSLKVADESVFAWTDSMIVLSWLRKNPNVWKTYVANRTTEILNVLGSDRWHHITSSDNPADIATRGISPQLLKQSDLWWHGPNLLRESDTISFPQTEIPNTRIESKDKIHVGVALMNDEMVAYLKKYSKLSKLIRVTCYIIFVNICKHKANIKKAETVEPVSFPQYLTVPELNEALRHCIHMSQQIHFNNEITILNRGGLLPKVSRILSLNPFLDKDQILRVGGRLRNAPINFNKQSPIILSSQCNLSRLIVNDAHIRALHSGPQLTLNVVRSRYWIIGAKNLVKREIHKCIPCYKQSTAPITQLMGQLPACRVTPNKPFRSSGVDYAGPVILKLYPGRCQRTCKAYICLFVCTVTKAIHLELVSDLSTAAFLAAFRRFSSRRGHCSQLWSDCATNFVGASKELDILFKNRKSQIAHEIAELLANDNTKWNFIPPGSPHFGGLWEAGVKSVKGHLKRVIGQTRLTFVEFSTLLTQVEACVNSRPLTLPTGSVEDVPPITPGHFLMGEAPLTVPEDDLGRVQISHTDRWQMLQRMLQNLWHKWSSEYLSSLQNRYKWQNKTSEPELGSVVLVKDERLPPGKWLLGRIVDKHPGKDGLTRVVTLKYKNNLFKRPITKLCPLPLES